jgi:uncharacterized protein YydD (DUF2326 family)
MDQKIKFEDTEYEVENLSDQAKEILALLKFVTSRIQETNNMHALLQQAKNSYIKSLKQEMLSSKAGVLFGDD